METQGAGPRFRTDFTGFSDADLVNFDLLSGGDTASNVMPIELWENWPQKLGDSGGNMMDDLDDLHLQHHVMLDPDQEKQINEKLFGAEPPTLAVPLVPVPEHRARVGSEAENMLASLEQ